MMDASDIVMSNGVNNASDDDELMKEISVEREQSVKKPTPFEHNLAS